MKMYNILGRRIRIIQKKRFENTYEIELQTQNIKGLPVGIYFISIDTIDGPIYKKSGHDSFELMDEI